MMYLVSKYDIGLSIKNLINRLNYFTVRLSLYSVQTPNEMYFKAMTFI